MRLRVLYIITFTYVYLSLAFSFASQTHVSNCMSVNSSALGTQAHMGTWAQVWARAYSS